MSQGWSRPADILAKVRRRWDSGALLRLYASGEPFEAITVTLRGPRAGEIGDDLVATREWIAALDAAHRDGTRYELRWRTVGGRSIGRNEIPSHAAITSFEQAWALLGVAAEVRRFEGLLATVEKRDAVREWLVARPMQALELAPELPRLLAALDWLEANRGSGRYLRETTAPGVDTKFIEGHRAVLARIMGVPARRDDFLAALGLGIAPALVHLRPSPSLGVLGGLSELAARVGELATLPFRPGRVLVVENRITYLSVPVPEDGIVIWGQGFDVGKIGSLPWLERVDVSYWGDLDPRGFEILNLLRRRLPQVRSVLMDRDTLERHRDRCVTEPTTPAPAPVELLTPAEFELYRDLVEDRLGDRVRLEQERIDWEWALSRLGN